MKIFIVGGGFLGQLIHTVLPKARVFDWRNPTGQQRAQSRDFGPQYLWAPIPTLPCTEFMVYTTVDGNPATPETVLNYKRKVGKDLDDADWIAQFQPQMRGWNVILPEPRVEYGKRLVSIDRLGRKFIVADGTEEHYDALISTIPLYALMGLVNLRLRASSGGATDGLESRAIYAQSLPMLSEQADMHVDYVSIPNTDIYRITDRGKFRHYESLTPFSTGPSHKLTPGKIYPHPEAAVTVDVLRERYGIYCFGRYGTWRPEELAHQTYAEVQRWLLPLQD